MASSFSQIDKLNKDNFETWRMQMEAILIKNDHWLYVNGEKKEPADPKEKETWKKTDQKARADIVLAIQPSELCTIKHCKTSAELWEKLKGTYISRGPAKKATLLKQLLFTKMKEDDTMTDHLNTFFNFVDQLKEMGLDVGDDLLSILMLYSIPNTYENFRCAIEARDDLPKPEVLKIKLLDEFNARRGFESQEPQNVLYTKTKAQWSKNYKKYDPKAKKSSSNDLSHNKKSFPFKCNKGCSY